MKREIENSSCLGPSRSQYWPESRIFGINIIFMVIVVARRWLPVNNYDSKSVWYWFCNDMMLIRRIHRFLDLVSVLLDTLISVMITRGWIWFQFTSIVTVGNRSNIRSQFVVCHHSEVNPLHSRSGSQLSCVWIWNESSRILRILGQVEASTPMSLIFLVLIFNH